MRKNTIKEVFISGFFILFISCLFIESTATISTAKTKSETKEDQVASVPYHRQPYQATLSSDGQLTRTISISGAQWLRVHFSDYNLGKSYLTVTSIADGATQRLDAGSFPRWNNGSAYMNGGSVEVTLHVASGDTGVYAAIAELTVGDPPPIAGSSSSIIEPDAESLCGNDNRFASTDARVGRLMPIGCTAWLISNGAVLTAGHCVDVDPDRSGPLLPDGIVDTAGIQIVEFNVPASNSNGTTNSSAPQDQYPVNLVDSNSDNIPDSMSFRYDGEGQGLGKDWAVFQLNNNATTGGNPHVQRGFFRVTRTNPNPGVSTMRVTGYGVDSTPPGTGGGRNAQNQTEQTSTGTYTSETVVSANQIYHQYAVDTTGGNSGSPAIRVSDGIAYAIHTNAGCGATSGSNSGTSFEVNALENAINIFQGPTAEHVDPGFAPFNPPAAANGSIMEPWDTVTQAVNAAAAGSVIPIVKGTYLNGPITINKNVKLLAPVGTVTIQ